MLFHHGPGTVDLEKPGHGGGEDKEHSNAKGRDEMKYHNVQAKGDQRKDAAEKVSADAGDGKNPGILYDLGDLQIKSHHHQIHIGAHQKIDQG